MPAVQDRVNMRDTPKWSERTTADFLSQEVSFRERLRAATREIESRLIMDALERNRWNRRRAAEALQISYRSLMYKMKRCNLRDSADFGKPEEE
jgi:DNA-binding NtrC family response regulator